MLNYVQGAFYQYSGRCYNMYRGFYKYAGRRYNTYREFLSVFGKMLQYVQGVSISMREDVTIHKGCFYQYAGRLYNKYRWISFSIQEDVTIRTGGFHQCSQWTRDLSFQFHHRTHNYSGHVSHTSVLPSKLMT